MPRATEPNSTPELLSPAGNWDCARAAVAAGADAIFFGLPRFNARLRADNFTDDDLPELMDFLHRHGVKGFVTMNTLIFTGELESAEKQLRKIAEAGVDALIIQDLGLAKLARTVAPNVELHASTQMTITSPEGLAFVESLFPMERAVLARELSLKEIERFHAASIESLNLKTPLEVFVHGALCVAYSGQCLTSESLGQRSANRGECAQACRMPYELVVDGETRDMGEHRYLLSPQDLAAADLIPGLVKAGVKSFKIEGRLKSPEYVAAVTRVYRKAIDAALSDQPNPITPSDRYELEMTFSRGLTTGWLAGTNHPYLTHGRFGKKRGPVLGEIEACGHGWITLKNTTGVPIAAGDGVVFDAGENRDLEQGARIWKIEGDRLIFHRTYSGINFSRIQPGHTLYKTSDPKLESEIRRFWQNAKPAQRKTPLHLTVSGSPGEPITLRHGSHSVRSETLLGIAEKRPLDTEVLTAQLSRLGDTPYELASLDNQLHGDCHFPLSALNQLRRDLVEKLDSTVTEAPPSPQIATTFRDLLPSIIHDETPAPPSLSVLCRSMVQVNAAIDSGVTSVYCDFEDPRRYKEAVSLFREQSTTPEAKIHLATPRILKPGETGYLKLIERAEPDGLLLRNLASLHYYKDRSDLIKIGDFSLNVANPITAKLLMENASLDHLTVSYDLNIGQVLDLLDGVPNHWFELTLHQHMPMFHMEHCVFCTFLSSGTTYKDCGRPCENHVVHLRDRVGQLHRLQADVGCRNTLFNGRAQTGARFYDELRSTGLSRFRVELLDEDDLGSLRTIQAYQNLLSGRSDAETLLDNVRAFEKLGVTEGTLVES
ncbi:U32 family peptidase [Luteolibacter pohnpeiensis]|uniref:U32 family peptidase n=1 Tax=Luteolibacter pohnpeiensis TaxID=454153 RepID=A0A934S4P0_9BACT|nr:U32 family peptidase [Luteolibacter pohnpeiensis]MBK1883075.1 U32 family peptidase [Luteolibacter pohnpeiensis]